MVANKIVQKTINKKRMKGYLLNIIFAKWIIYLPRKA